MTSSWVDKVGGSLCRLSRRHCRPPLSSSFFVTVMLLCLRDPAATPGHPDRLKTTRVSSSSLRSFSLQRSLK